MRAREGTYDEALEFARLCEPVYSVTLPVLILVYEFLFHAQPARRLRTGLITSAAAAIYTAGKMFSPGSLAQIDPYRPSFTIATS